MPIRVSVGRKPKINVTTRIAVPESLSGVDNVNVDNVRDGSVLMYDNTLQRYAFVDPDVLLSKSVEDNSLPEDFMNRMDAELDNKINLDAGQF